MQGTIAQMQEHLVVLKRIAAQLDPNVSSE
jgi:hypothetical protein